MPQIQVQQKLYQNQFKKFSTLVGQVDPEYCSVAWGVAHREGLEAAIAFCDSKLCDSQIMQAYRLLDIYRGGG